MQLQRYIAIFCILGTLGLGTGTGAAQGGKRINVSVNGIADPLLKNVRASLALIFHQNDENLTESQVKRFYALAEEEIVKALEPFGYYSPQIIKQLVPDQSGWKVDLTVTPGEPVRVIKCDIRLTGPGTDDTELKKNVSGYRFPLQPGDILDHQRYEEGKKELASLAIAGGYRDVTFVQNVVRVDKQLNSAQIMLVIDTGSLYRFGTTTFAADFLSADLLRRMLPYRENDPYSPDKIVLIRQTLLNSDYFSQVDVETGDVPAGSLQVPVLVRLQKRSPNRYSIGIGYGTDTGARGSLEWANRLLNRYGHQLKIQVQPSERKNNIAAAYTIPVHDPRKDRLALTGKWEKEYFVDTETEARNVTISYDHIGAIGEYSGYVQYLDEDYEVGLDKGHDTFLYPGIKTTWRFADDRLKTKRGVRITLDAAGASNDLVSDASFFQGKVTSKAIYSFFDTWRVLGRFQFGWTKVDNILDLSPSLRFYAGGDQSIRGYAYKSIGPEDAAGNVIGASQLITWSLELEKELFDNWSAAVFYDTGDAMNSLNDMRMHDSSGFGIRWNAPFGQVRLDLAMPLSEGKSSWRIHFNVGADL